MERDRDLEMAKRIAEAVDAASGRTYFVGGCVRDRLMGRENKDMDIEVHGVSVETLEGILDGLGERIAVGASFGVMGLRHYGLDIAMPRSERATGRGHKDFAVFVDPFLGEEKAASRRDFTINAMMQNVLTGEILDFFGGRRDLELGRIRHVNGGTFAEDPLRVFRAAQFAARFGFQVAPETVELCSSMAVDALAGERVMGELEKALLRSETPSVFFETLREMDQLSAWFPEAGALIGVPQDPEYHPEGDVWVHTMHVLDAAALLREESREPLALMLSALCHDFGKPSTTCFEDGRIRALGHEKEGIPIAERFLNRLTRERRLLAAVKSHVSLHMLPNALPAERASEKAYLRLFDRSACPEDLILLAKADALGQSRSPEELRAKIAVCGNAERKLREMLALYRERTAQPGVTGADLIAAGFEPGADFGPALEQARSLLLAGRDREEQFRQALGVLRKARSGKAESRKADEKSAEKGERKEACSTGI